MMQTALLERNSEGLLGAAPVIPGSCGTREYKFNADAQDVKGGAGQYFTPCPLNESDNPWSSVFRTILETILSKSPYEFEKLVVKLLDRWAMAVK